MQAISLVQSARHFSPCIGLSAHLPLFPAGVMLQ